MYNNIKDKNIIKFFLKNVDVEKKGRESIIKNMIDLAKNINIQNFKKIKVDKNMDLVIKKEDTESFWYFLNILNFYKEKTTTSLIKISYTQFYLIALLLNECGSI
jgi:hypothetical protein